MCCYAVLSSPVIQRDAGAGVGVGVGVGASSDGVLSPRFSEDVRALFERLDTPAALGRACEAAVRTPLPSLEDVRELLEVLLYMEWNTNLTKM